MATPVSFGCEAENPAGPADVDYNTGATMDSDNVVQVNYDADVFTQAKGKERLLLALKQIVQKIERSDTTWPAS